MELILLGHIIGDFYAQTDKMAEKKKTSIKYMLIHCLIYTIAVGSGLFLLYRGIETIVILCVIYLSHFIIDMIKQKCDRKYAKYQHMNFITDQIAHIVVLFLTIYFAKRRFNFVLVNNPVINSMNVKLFISIVLAILVCWKPAAIFISLVLERLPETKEKVNSKEKKGVGKSLEAEDTKVGYWIGILEREIILILGLIGEFGAIGFVLTAKSLARFKQLEDKSFAEKYLVGTLLSAFIAICCVVIYKVYSGM